MFFFFFESPPWRGGGGEGGSWVSVVGEGGTAIFKLDRYVPPCQDHLLLKNVMLPLLCRRLSRPVSFSFVF